MQKGSRKVILTIVVLILNVLIIAGLIVGGILAKQSLDQMNNRISYVQDTLSILLSDVGNMKEEIQTTLEEEGSLIEEHSFTLVDMNFEDMTYTLDVMIMPKVYTESTEVSIFFGTTQFDLDYQEFFYTGTVVLPLDDSYEGNVTVLFKDGNQKSTEVMKDYSGFANEFGPMLSATAMTTPTVKEGVVTAKGPARIELTGNNRFLFKQLNLYVEVDGEKVFRRDYLQYRETLSSGEALQDYDIDGDALEAKNHDAVMSLSNVDSSDLEFDALNNDKIRIYLEAITEEGYVLQYDVFNGTVNKDGTGFDENSISVDNNRCMIDTYGNKLMLSGIKDDIIDSTDTQQKNKESH